MTGEEILFLIVVWALASVPMSVLLGGVIGVGAESEALRVEASQNVRTEEAA